MAIVNITTYSDADFIRGFAYQYDPSGAPVDLTGQKLRMGIRKHAADVIEELLLTTENGGLVISDASGGKFTVWIKHAQLEALAAGEYEHSLIRIVTSNGLQLRIWSGALTHNIGASRGKTND
ncbi:hypothetical protein [Bradyrhizobium sp. USDA 313]|uniref:hypothetical protein n=1 Tax=Bradyrhizobium sp. USDA 313 TaxID=3156307 RepID=UPI0035172F80